MTQSESNILILKPTSQFISFISSQLPGIELPSLDLLRADTTAYSLPGCDSDDAVLAELEKFFPLMLKYEASRLVGPECANNITGSFLDFLCCFKFDLHSRVLLMEPTIYDAHQLVSVKPRAIEFKWRPMAQENQLDFSSLLKKIDLSRFSESATILVKNFEYLTDISPFIQHHYEPLVNAEMTRMSESAEDWPSVNSFTMFSEYFEVEIHSQLIHLH